MLAKLGALIDWRPLGVGPPETLGVGPGTPFGRVFFGSWGPFVWFQQGTTRKTSLFGPFFGVTTLIPSNTRAELFVLLLCPFWVSFFASRNKLRLQGSTHVANRSDIRVLQIVPKEHQGASGYWGRLVDDVGSTKLQAAQRLLSFADVSPVFVLRERTASAVQPRR